MGSGVGDIAARGDGVAIGHGTIVDSTIVGNRAEAAVTAGGDANASGGGIYVTGGVEVGQTSASQPLTLTNSGDLPAGMTVAATPGLSNTCGGSVIGATTGSNTVSLGGGALAAGPSSCQVHVKVTSSTAGTAGNATGPVSGVGSGSP